MGKQNKPIAFDIVNGREYIWKTPTKIETLDIPAEVCPHSMLLIKSNRSAAGAKASASHSASLAADDAVCDQLLKNVREME